MKHTKKRLGRLLGGLLVCCLLGQTAGAALPNGTVHSATAQRNALRAAATASAVKCGAPLTEEEAAMRLYHLKMLSGTATTVSGGITFDLERDLTRLEAAVFAVRLMGRETEALTAQYNHPFTDVPEWAGAYVGLLYKCGLTTETKDNLFAPHDAEPVAVFLGYMLYALGYSMQDGGYNLLNAYAKARAAGIYTQPAEAPLTRGGAVIAMYNTLRTTQNGSDKMLSDTLVETGRMDYTDAVFLLWSERKEETKRYMDAVGYTTSLIVPDGYYAVTGSNEMVLNVLADGPNREYEGLGVTLWEPTNDISQSFRLERTERGTYLLYAACSRGGFFRVLGAAADGVHIGVYQSTSHNALEWQIEATADGLWQLSAEYDGKTVYLSIEGTDGLCLRGDAPSVGWRLEKQGITDGMGRDLALFPAQTMMITQGAYDVYSHQSQNALDMQPTNQMAFAPFNAKVVKVNPGYSGCNGVWIESVDKVRYADGSYDYMTVLFMHDDDIADLTVGRVLTQGEFFYQCGNAGNSSGKHIHIAVYRGQYNSSMRLGSGDVNVEDAFFVRDTTVIRDDYGLNWKSVSEAS